MDITSSPISINQHGLGAADEGARRCGTQHAPIGHRCCFGAVGWEQAASSTHLLPRAHPGAARGQKWGRRQENGEWTRHGAKCGAWRKGRSSHPMSRCISVILQLSAFLDNTDTLVLGRSLTSALLTVPGSKRR